MTGSMMIMIILMTRQTRRPWIWVMNCTPSRNIYKGHNLKNCRTGMNSKRACSHDQIDQVSMGECHDCYFVISEYSHIWLFLGWAICQLWSHLWASQISRVWCEKGGFTSHTLGVCHCGHMLITRQTRSGICVMYIMSVRFISSDTYKGRSLSISILIMLTIETNSIWIQLHTI